MNQEKMIEKLIKEGYSIDKNILIEYLLLDAKITQTLISEVLKRVIALEKQVAGLPHDDGSIREEYLEILNKIADLGTEKKNSAIADLFSKSN